MKNVIEVSFREDAEEVFLKNEIVKRSKFLTKSGWMKLAAAEKIQRDTNQEIKIIDDFIKNYK